MTFATELTVETIRTVLEQAARQANFDVQSWTSLTGDQVITMRLRDSLWRSLIRRLPSRVDFHIWRADGQTFLYCDCRLSRGYLAIVGLLGALMALLLGYAGVKQRSSFTSVQFIEFFAALVGFCFVVFVNFQLVLGSGIERLQPVLGTLRQVAIADGSVLASVGYRIGRRYLCLLLGYLIFVATNVLLFAFAIGRAGKFSQFTGNGAVILGPLLLLLMATVAIIPLMLRHQGLSARLLPALGTGTFCVAVLVMSAIPIPWLLIDRGLSLQDAQKVLATRAFLRGEWNGAPPILPDGRPATAADVRDTYRTIQSMGWSLISVSIFIGIIGVAYALSSFTYTANALPHLQQLKKRPDFEPLRQTIDPRSFIGPFRAVWGLIWFSLACCLFVAFLGVARCGLDLLASVSHAPIRQTLNAVDLSVLITALALDVRPDCRWLVSGIYVGWGCYVLAAIGLVTASIGSFASQEKAARQRWLLAKNQEVPGRQTLPRDQLAEKLHRCSPNIDMPEMIWISSRRPLARAWSVGIFKAHRFIEVGTRCAEILTQDEMYALCAHELAHHVLGHCRRDMILRFLGRLTLVGDGFVRILEDSFGYELEADRFAVEQLGVNPQAMIHCLGKLRVLAAMETQEVVESIIALPIKADDEPALPPAKVSMTWTQRIRVGMVLQLHQYMGADNNGYWHPSTAQRITVMETFRSSFSNGNPSRLPETSEL